MYKKLDAIKEQNHTRKVKKSKENTSQKPYFPIAETLKMTKFIPTKLLNPVWFPEEDVWL